MWHVWVYLAVGVASGHDRENDGPQGPFTCSSFIDNRSLPVLVIYDNRGR